MIIRKMLATFGALDNARLELKPGLNIVQAPNEAGKSTWCAFLRVMLYGLKTQDRDKIGYLADKSRYRPWSGAPMAGSMDIEFGGQALTLQRKGRGAAPMKDLSVVYTGTGEAAPGLGGEDTGEQLTGVPEAVFTRSAFIRQAGLGVDRSGELESRISALVSTGDEGGVSYGDAEARLREWQRKRYVNRANGRIAQLDKELEQLRAALARQGEAGARQEELQAGVEALRAECALLSDEKAALESSAQAEQARRRGEQAQRLERLQGRVRELEESLSRDGRVLEKADAQSVRNDCAAYQALRVELAGVQAGQESDAAALAAEERALSASPYKGKSAGEARAAAAEKLRAYKGAATVKAYDPKRFRVGYILLALLAALCAGTAALKFGQSPWYPLAFAVGLAALAGIFVLCLSGIDQKRKRAAAEEAMAEILAACGAGDSTEIEESAKRYVQALEALEARRQTLAAGEAALEEKKAEARALTARLERGLALFQADSGDIQAALGQIDRCERQMDELAALRLSAASEEKLLAQMDALRQAQPSAAEPAAELVPRYSLEETARRLALADGQLRAAEQQYSAARGEARALGDPMALGAEILRLENARAEQAAQYEALALALENLEAANTELRSRFSPALSRRAGEIAGELTEGRYKGLYFDRDWNAQARLEKEPAPRDSLYLSAGARDQMYLALRLAICELLLGGEEPCPIILDDALANFDDRRTEKALDWLKGMAAGRQVIVMTCHSREAAYFAGQADVNIIRA